MRLIAILLTFGLLVGGTPGPGADAAVTLTVTVTDLRNATGTVGLALYDESAMSDFPDADPIRTDSIPADVSGVEVRFPDLPEGRYALAAIHDESGNGVLDSNDWGMPVEGFGFSNDVMGQMGPPSFESAAFSVEEDRTVSISMIYMGGD